MEGSVCLVYENVNGYINWLCDDDKVEQSKEVHDELEVDVAAYCKHTLNMKHRQNVHGFSQLFKGGKASIQSNVAHNVHKNICRTQQGGTR